MYRREAQGVPNLLKASIPQTQPTAEVIPGGELEDGEYGGDEDVEDPNGEQFYYEDGNYWRAAPTTAVNEGGLGQDPDELQYDDFEGLEEEDIDPQEAYYSSLMTRFNTFRARITTPSEEILGHPISMPNYNAPRAHWEDQILNSSPSMAALYHMEQKYILQAIARAEDVLTKKHLLDGRRGRNLSAWCWGLLGRCKAVDEMVSEEVGVLRGLARRAVGILRKWRTRKPQFESTGATINGPDQLRKGNAVEAVTGVQEGQGSSEEGEIVEDEEGGDKIRGIVNEGADDLNLSNTSQAEPPTQEAESLSSSNVLLSGEDAAALELARQKLLEQLSLSAPTEKSPSKHSSPHVSAGENHALRSEAKHNTLLEQQQGQKPQDQHGLIPLETSTSKHEPNPPVPDHTPAPSHAQTPAELEDGETEEGEIDTTDEGESEAEESDPVIGSESRRPVPDPETAALATLDMIITVVGEFWGQRDLLAQREIWGEYD